MSILPLRSAIWREYPQDDDLKLRDDDDDDDERKKVFLMRHAVRAIAENDFLRAVNSETVSTTTVEIMVSSLLRLIKQPLCREKASCFVVIA